MSYAFFRVQISSGCLTFLLDALRPVVPKRKTYPPVCLTLLGRCGPLGLTLVFENAGAAGRRRKTNIKANSFFVVLLEII
jgi:hypothetical protein